MVASLAATVGPGGGGRGVLGTREPGGNVLAGGAAAAWGVAGMVGPGSEALPGMSRVMARMNGLVAARGGGGLFRDTGTSTRQALASSTQGGNP